MDIRDFARSYRVFAIRGVDCSDCYNGSNGPRQKIEHLFPFIPSQN